MNNEFICTFINSVDIRKVPSKTIIKLYDVLFTVHLTIIGNKMILHSILFNISESEISVKIFI